MESFNYKTNSYYETNLLMLKPDCLKRGLTSTVINMLLQKGYSISNMKIGMLSEKTIEKLYCGVKDEGFFEDMKSYLKSGPVIIMLVHGSDVITDAANIIGPTMANKSIVPGSIREFRESPDTEYYDKVLDFVNIAHYPKPPKNNDLPIIDEAMRDSEILFNELEPIDFIYELEKNEDAFISIKTPAKEYMNNIYKKLRF